MENELMRKMANMIVANLGYTTEIGLFNGKMGVAIFLYRYSQYINCQIYHDIADSLMDEICNQIVTVNSHELSEGIAGVGIGLSLLLKEGKIEGDPNEILAEIDNRLLGDYDTSFKNLENSITSFSSGLYLLSRLKLGGVSKNEMWKKQLKDVGKAFMSVQSKKDERSLSSLSLINSLIYVYSELDKNESENKISDFVFDLMNMGVIIVNNDSPDFPDVLLFKKLVDSISGEVDFRIDYEMMKEQVDLFKISPEIINNHLYLSWLYGLDLCADPFFVNMLRFVSGNDYILDSVIVNNLYSILGLGLIREDEKKIFCKIE